MNVEDVKSAEAKWRASTTTAAKSQDRCGASTTAKMSSTTTNLLQILSLIANARQFC